MTAALLAPVAGGPPILDRVHHCDLLTLANALPPQSVDMILTDLPYGTTANRWDAVIPFEPMWSAFRRILKNGGVIALTASQPFTSELVASNRGMFKYEWIWVKSQATQFLDANRKPLKAHESILIFSAGSPFYNPQFRKGDPYKTTRNGTSSNYRHFNRVSTVSAGDRYPLSVIHFSVEVGLHPTQKPVALFEYLIKTYTRPDELVVDFCSGSGTTAIAARNTGRRFVCCDNGTDERTGKTWAAIATERLRNTDPMQSRIVAPNTVQRSLFESIST